MSLRQNQFFFSNIIFFIAAGTTIITLTSAIFPALILGSIEAPKYPSRINVFEAGVLAYPILITNSIFSVVIILHIIKKFPPVLYRAIRTISNFDVSHKVAFISMIIIIGVYILVTAGEIFEGESWEDYTRTVKPTLDSWNTDKFFDTGNPLTFFLLDSSKKIWKLQGHAVYRKHLTACGSIPYHTDPIKKKYCRDYSSCSGSLKHHI